MRRARALITAGGLLLAGLGTAPTASSAPTVPNLLTEQGRLLDTSGNPVMGTATLVFTLYDAATAGNVLWTETQMTTLDGGYFSTQLGQVTAIPTTAFNGSARYLGVSVNGDPEMTPRQTVASTPYALVADNATGNITPTSVSVGGATVINSQGQWVGALVNRLPAGNAGRTHGCLRVPCVRSPRAG